MPDSPTPTVVANSYDEVPYDSHPFPQTHPSRLFTVATLFGLTPAPVEAARVLELGCAVGGNLIPMAEAFPDARFVGVDRSGRQIADGRRLVRQLGLSNLDLRHASILDVDESFGRFDYVVCHGVFSWVPPDVRDKILAVCARHLTPEGVAYISYNTYPGWHMRGLIRDMMRYHTAQFATPADRTRQARALLDFLADSVPQDGKPYALLLRQELEALRYHADSYLYHEQLEDVNDPLYFHQFVELAGRHGLRYLGESRVASMLPGAFGPAVEKALRLLGNDQVRTEQYLDFLRNRMFRETLLVPARAQPRWTITPDRVARLHFSSGSRPADDRPIDLRSEEPAQYRTPGGLGLATNRPVLKAAMAALAEAWPGTLSFEELLRRSRELLGVAVAAPEQSADEAQLQSGLLDSYMGTDLVEFHGSAVRVARSAGERPLALPAVRLGAGEGRAVANGRHETVRLPDFARHMVPLLDGTRDRPAILAELERLARDGEVRVQREGRTVTGPEEIRTALAALLEQALKDIAASALLAG
ncbi:MAG: class I SAM-dependent methyltransferase [Gemmataceae bacterium]|nr:class I SAM-dependent methyltransferase [Gemmataceae bacterium]